MRLGAARALVVLATLVLVLALVAGYVRHVAVDSDQFANRATVALQDASVRSLIGQEVTDRIVLKNKADLIAARPLIEGAVSGVVGSTAFDRLFRGAVRDVHRAVFDHDEDTVVLTLADVGTVVAAGLQAIQPKLANEVQATGRVEVVRRDLGSSGGDLARAAKTVRVIAILLLVGGLLLAAGALVLYRDTRQGFVELGVGVATGGIVLVVAYGILRSAAIDHVHGAEQRAAAGAVWDAFLADLRTAAWIMAGCGAVVAAAADSLLRPVDVRVPLRRAGAWLTREPERTWVRAARGVGLVAAGVLVIVERDAVVSLAVTVLGVFLIYTGVTAILRLVYRPRAPEEVAEETRGSWPRRLLVPALAAVLIVGAVGVFLGSGATTTAAPGRGGCDGHAALCAKRLDRVVLPATHNAMSAPLPGWYSSEQDRPIAGQLQDGVRGLLVDTHYADRLANGRLRTVIVPGSKASPDGLSQDAIDAAERLRARAGYSGEGKRGMYLCHTFCELGATSLSSVLDDIHTFLVANPGEVLVIINEDYVRPADFVGAIEKAHLGSMVLTPPAAGEPWPTLGQMVDSGRRLLVMAENRAGAAPWYQLAYQRLTEETPFSFRHTSLLADPAHLEASCRPNRGPKSAPLFLINHWISTDPVPLPSHAATVNAYEPLLARARACEKQRHHVPNLLAVNFYRQGNLFRVVDTLNGV